MAKGFPDFLWQFGGNRGFLSREMVDGGVDTKPAQPDLPLGIPKRVTLGSSKNPAERDCFQPHTSKNSDLCG